jgi:hypothetical protein
LWLNDEPKNQSAWKKSSKGWLSMEPYEIIFQPSVEKDIRKLSLENCDRIMVSI